jgi:hypothetical protein
MLVILYPSLKLWTRKPRCSHDGIPEDAQIFWGFRPAACVPDMQSFLFGTPQQDTRTLFGTHNRTFGMSTRTVCGANRYWGFSTSRRWGKQAQDKASSAVPPPRAAPQAREQVRSTQQRMSMSGWRYSFRQADGRAKDRSTKQSGLHARLHSLALTPLFPIVEDMRATKMPRGSRVGLCMGRARAFRKRWDALRALLRNLVQTDPAVCLGLWVQAMRRAGVCLAGGVAASGAQAQGGVPGKEARFARRAP